MNIDATLWIDGTETVKISPEQEWLRQMEQKEQSK